MMTMWLASYSHQLLDYRRTTCVLLKPSLQTNCSFRCILKRTPVWLIWTWLQDEECPHSWFWSSTVHCCLSKSVWKDWASMNFTISIVVIIEIEKFDWMIIINEPQTHENYGQCKLRKSFGDLHSNNLVETWSWGAQIVTYQQIQWRPACHVSLSFKIGYQNIMVWNMKMKMGWWTTRGKCGSQMARFMMRASRDGQCKFMIWAYCYIDIVRLSINASVLVLGNPCTSLHSEVTSCYGGWILQ